MIAPSRLEKKGERMLVVTWNDGVKSEYDVRDLRLHCPCASCVNEWTGEKTLDPAMIAKDVRPQRILSVGRYAMGVHWSDGHSTGIYAYDYLRRLAEA